MADGGTVGSPGVSKNPVTVGGSDRMNSATEGWQLFVVRGFTASGAQTFYLHVRRTRLIRSPLRAAVGLVRAQQLAVHSPCGDSSTCLRTTSIRYGLWTAPQMWPYQDPGQPNITTVLDVGQTVRPRCVHNAYQGVQQSASPLHRICIPSFPSHVHPSRPAGAFNHRRCVR